MSAASQRQADVLRERAARHGQDHLFRFWDELDEAARAELLLHVAEVDFDRLSRLIHGIRSGAPSVSIPRPLQPAPFLSLGSPEVDKQRLEATREGEQALRAGRVAVLVVAGGQGTRLGHPAPKGTLSIGPLSGKSLYQFHAEKILALGRRHGRPIPWYVLTSEATDAPTRQFFEHHRFFGLSRDQVRFIVQGMMPAIDREGRILMEARSRIFRSPNGHGGVIEALVRTKTLDEMREARIEVLFYFQVDNPLVRIADPVFLGHHLLASAEMSVKVVRKRRPEEKVGVLVNVEGRARVIEYSELTSQEMAERLPDGSLRLQAGNIAIHAFATRFLDRLAREAEGLPYHQALKKISCIDESGRLTEPGEPNGIKFERFVFDALPLASRVVALEVAREEEFSPVKNASGAESPETATADLMALHRRWLAAAGVPIPDRAESLTVEISPLFALDADELRERARVRAIHVTDRLHLESESS